MSDCGQSVGSRWTTRSVAHGLSTRRGNSRVVHSTAPLDAPFGAGAAPGGIPPRLTAPPLRDGGWISSPHSIAGVASTAEPCAPPPPGRGVWGQRPLVDFGKSKAVVPGPGTAPLLALSLAATEEAARPFCRLLKRFSKMMGQGPQGRVRGPPGRSLSDCGQSVGSRWTTRSVAHGLSTRRGNSRVVHSTAPPPRRC